MYLVRRDLLALLESKRGSRGQGRVPALALVEIDRFLDLSDLHGRATGEHVMQQLTGLVREHASKLDVVERFYDDLIVIVVPQPDASAVGRSAEAIRAAIEGHGFDPSGLRVTASIGLAFGEPNILDEARGNLRRAKLLGGNQVVSWDGDATGQLRGHQVVPWPDEQIRYRPPLPRGSTE